MSEGRASTAGKSLGLHGKKMQVRGVTYGTFAPHAGEGGYPDPSSAAQ